MVCAESGVAPRRLDVEAVPAVYAAWIANYVAEARLVAREVFGDEMLGVYGDCATATEKLVAAHPELRRVRGHYLCAHWGARTHWWCETVDGRVVDPTAGQFPSLGRGVYVEFAGTEEHCRSGVCRDCGGAVYGGADFCSSACESRYMAYLNGGQL